MSRKQPTRPVRYRVWLTLLGAAKPQSPTEIPQETIALEPAEQGTMSALQAARYVQAYNQAALSQASGKWAVAVPVVVRYEGEPRPGQPLAGLPLPPVLKPPPGRPPARD